VLAHPLGGQLLGKDIKTVSTSAVDLLEQLLSADSG
jgi:hypothetical protein